MTVLLPRIPYPIPENEKERLAALSSFEILDTPPEASLDRMVTLAARLFNAPVSFFSLVDERRQWVKAKHGSKLNETDRTCSLCAYATFEKEPMVVCDATRDARFQDNPLVTGELGLRFYTGAAVRTRAGLPLGSLCVIDTVARPRPSQEQLDNLSDLAFLITEHLESRLATTGNRGVTEQELRRSLQEKETLLQEVHHRVKNNLQIVSSLLKLQADSLTDRSAAAALKESRQRVLSMSLIHERLYSGKHMAEIEFADYARTLLNELVNSYSDRAGSVTGRLHPPPIRLNIGQAIPCGLILNELVTNALKYAYPAGFDGEVTVELSETPQGRVRLAVSDQGQGLPPNFDWKNAPSLGLRIADVLAHQLGGTLTVEPGQHTKFVLDFPRDEVTTANRVE